MEPRPSGPSGVRGWLLFFVISQVWALAITTIGLRTSMRVIVEDLDAAWRWPIYTFSDILQLGVILLILVGCLLGLYKIHVGGPEAARFYRAFLPAIAGATALLILTRWMGHQEIAKYLVEHGRSTTRIDGIWGVFWQTEITRVSYGLIWYLYWTRSVRVANTFGVARLGQQ